MKTSNPLSETDWNTRPMMPNGAAWMTHFTACDTAPAMSPTMAMVAAEAHLFRARPMMTDQKSMPM